MKITLNEKLFEGRRKKDIADPPDTDTAKAAAENKNDSKQKKDIKDTDDGGKARIRAEIEEKGSEIAKKFYELLSASGLAAGLEYYKPENDKEIFRIGVSDEDTKHDRVTIIQKIFKDENGKLVSNKNIIIVNDLKSNFNSFEEMVKFVNEKTKNEKLSNELVKRKIIPPPDESVNEPAAKKTAGPARPPIIKVTPAAARPKPVVAPTAPETVGDRPLSELPPTPEKGSVDKNVVDNGVKDISSDSPTGTAGVQEIPDESKQDLLTKSYEDFVEKIKENQNFEIETKNENNHLITFHTKKNPGAAQTVKFSKDKSGKVFAEYGTKGSTNKTEISDEDSEDNGIKEIFDYFTELAKKEPPSPPSREEAEIRTGVPRRKIVPPVTGRQPATAAEAPAATTQTENEKLAKQFADSLQGKYDEVKVSHVIKPPQKFGGRSIKNNERVDIKKGNKTYSIIFTKPNEAQIKDLSTPELAAKANTVNFTDLNDLSNKFEELQNGTMQPAQPVAAAPVAPVTAPAPEPISKPAAIQAPTEPAANAVSDADLSTQPASVQSSVVNQVQPSVEPAPEPALAQSSQTQQPVNTVQSAAPVQNQPPVVEPVSTDKPKSGDRFSNFYQKFSFNESDLYKNKSVFQLVDARDGERFGNSSFNKNLEIGEKRFDPASYNKNRTVNESEQSAGAGPQRLKFTDEECKRLVTSISYSEKTKTLIFIVKPTQTAGINLITSENSVFVFGEEYFSSINGYEIYGKKKKNDKDSEAESKLEKLSDVNEAEGLIHIVLKKLKVNESKDLVIDEKHQQINKQTNFPEIFKKAEVPTQTASAAASTPSPAQPPANPVDANAPATSATTPAPVQNQPPTPVVKKNALPTMDAKIKFRHDVLGHVRENLQKFMSLYPGKSEVLKKWLKDSHLIPGVDEPVEKSQEQENKPAEQAKRRGRPPKINEAKKDNNWTIPTHKYWQNPDNEPTSFRSTEIRKQEYRTLDKPQKYRRDNVLYATKESDIIDAIEDVFKGFTDKSLKKQPDLQPYIEKLENRKFFPVKVIKLENNLFFVKGEYSDPLYVIAPINILYERIKGFYQTPSSTNESRVLKYTKLASIPFDRANLSMSVMENHINKGVCAVNATEHTK